MALAVASLLMWLYIRQQVVGRKAGIPRFYPGAQREHPAPRFEKAVLVRMIVEPDCIPIVDRLFTADDFAGIEERNAYNSIILVFRERGTPTLPIDVLINEIAKRNSWVPRMAKQYLDSLLDGIEDEDIPPYEPMAERRAPAEATRTKPQDREPGNQVRL